MNTFLVILFSLLGVATSIGICLSVLRKPICFKVDTSIGAWIDPVLILFACIIISFLLDYWLGAAAKSALDKNKDVIVNSLSVGDWMIFVILLALANGFLIPVFCVISSALLGLYLRYTHLIYLYSYSEKVPKVCFSVLVSFFCLKLVFFIDLNESVDNVGFYVARILMWLITIFGTWFGFGIGCGVQFKKHKNRKKRNSFTKNKKAFVSFFSNLFSSLGKKKKIPNKHKQYIRKELYPLIVTMLFFIVVLFSPIDSHQQELNIIIISFTVPFIILLLLLGIIVRVFVYPNEKRSVKILKKNIEALKNGNAKMRKGKFGRIRYSITPREFVINEVVIKYNGSKKDVYKFYFDEETHKLYGNRKLKLSKPKKIVKYLVKRKRTQDGLITYGFKCCELELMENKKKQLGK